MPATKLNSFDLRTHCQPFASDFSAASSLKSSLRPLCLNYNIVGAVRSLWSNPGSVRFRTCHSGCASTGFAIVSAAVFCGKTGSRHWCR